MKKFRKSILIIFSVIVILSISGHNSFSQYKDEIKNKISSQFEKFNKIYPQEKIYIHFDKPFYIPGETIWYKTYLVNTGRNTPSSLSNIIYVELFDTNGKIITRQTLKADYGFAKGDLLLPASLLDGNYLVKAYTNWMRNFDQEFFFTKEIQIFDPEKVLQKLEIMPSEKITTKKSQNKKIDLQFFPEGGYLVSGLSSKVAFKATNSAGEGIHVKGEIIDQDGNAIIPFESFHLGMGAFILKPEKGKTYIAILISHNEEKVNYSLPAALEKGLAMAVNNSYEDSLKVSIRANEAFLEANSGEVFLVIRSENEIYTIVNGDVRIKSTFEVAFAKKDIPTGVVQLTLFNAGGNPECERMAFINRHHTLQVKIKADKKVYNPREKVLLDISVIDINGNPVAGNFSLSVTDASQVVEVEKYNSNILTNLLLTSELKGNIEQPAFYFAKDKPGSETALDYLMLTQGWRRFLWKEILNDRWPSINYDFEKNSIVGKGQVLDSSIDSPVTSMRVSFLMLNENEPYIRFTDENGFFNYYINATYEKESLFFDVTTGGQHDRFKFFFDNNLPIYQSVDRKKFLYKRKEINSCLKKRRERSQIESSFNYTAENNIFYNANLEINDEGAKTNSNFGIANHTIKLDDYNPFPTMEEVFREIVTHVSLKYRKGGIKIRVYSDELMRSFDYQPLFFIDGIPTFNKSSVLNLAPDIVETIEVFKSTRKIRQFGFLGENGVVAIYTKKGALTSADISGKNIIEFQGCNNSREFYSPEYDNSFKTDRNKPDLRSLIYWNPLLITDSNGRASVSFYNTDNITTINATIEGISYDGIPGFQGYRYKINPFD